MKSIASILGAAVLLAALPSAQAEQKNESAPKGESVFSATFEDGDSAGASLNNGIGRICGGGCESAQCLLVESQGKSVYVSVPLPAGKLAGRLVEISAEVKAEGVSAKPKDWNGVKLQLALECKDGERSHPQAEMPSGSFGWQRFSATKLVPEDVKNASLVIGLEDVSGKAYFDNLQVVLLDSPAPAGK
jgi:hypothetical protein